jgi:hypothetical protein
MGRSLKVSPDRRDWPIAPVWGLVDCCNALRARDARPYGFMAIAHTPVASLLPHSGRLSPDTSPKIPVNTNFI